MKKIFTLLLILIHTILFSQDKGVIRGSVYDSETGEPLFAANVGVKGTSIGATTDFDGNFEIPSEKISNYLNKFNLASNDITLIISYIGYNIMEIENIKIKDDDIYPLENIKMAPNSVALEVINISAESVKNTEAALLTIKKKSPILIDAISAQSLKKSGDSDASGALKRVTGISVSDGKYVYVRGLGDRYTKTQLNSLDLPGLDPDRNTIQIDIFPTNIIDNIKVYKSFSANLPADFTGGIVDIAIKDFPEIKTLKISSNLRYNNSTHFNNNFLTYKGGKYDGLGIDDGTRALPISTDLQITQVDRVINFENLVDWSNKFNNELSASRKMSFMDGGFSISGGNQLNINDKKLGYIAALSFKNNYNYYENHQQNYWRKPIEINKYNLEPAKLINGEIGIQNAKLSSMLGSSIKNQNSKHKINFLYLRDTEKKAGIFYGENLFSNVNRFKKDVLEYSERSIINMFISGEYYLNDRKYKIYWKVSPTYSKIRDKDLRETPYLMSIMGNDTSYSVDVSNVGNPTRTWRFLDEYNVAASANLLFKHKLLEFDANLNSGINYSFKNRSYNVLGYSLTAYNVGQISFTGNPDEIMNSLLSETNSQSGFHIIGGRQLSNIYDGSLSNASIYLSEELNLNKKLKSIIGLRSEYYQQYYTGQNQAGDKYANKLVLKDIGVFPSLNVIYDISNKSKLRFSLSKTTARPSFKEKSLATIYDGISSITFNGNIDLEVTNINNFDFRYELYLEKNQTVSFSLFYKKLNNPIEISSFQADPDNIKPINTEKAEISGAEIELRKNIFSNLVHNLNLGLNASYIHSKAFIMGEELNSRISNLRDNETLTQSNGEYYRQMQGQAPYIINLSLSYQHKELGLESGIYYNVKGETLSIVSMNANPDIYTDPFNSLNFNLNKKINSHFSLGISLRNILKQNKTMITDSYGAKKEVYRSYNPGRFFGFKINYQI